MLSDHFGCCSNSASAASVRSAWPQFYRPRPRSPCLLIGQLSNSLDKHWVDLLSSFCRNLPNLHFHCLPKASASSFNGFTQSAISILVPTKIALAPPDRLSWNTRSQPRTLLRLSGRLHLNTKNAALASLRYAPNFCTSTDPRCPKAVGERYGYSLSSCGKRSLCLRRTD